MVNTYIVIAGILSIIGSLITLGLCYKIYLFNRLNKAWLAVVFAFGLIIIRRGIGFMRDYNLLPTLNSLLQSFESTLLIIISVLYIIGFWSMLKNFENFDVVQKKVQSKIEKKFKKH